MILLQLLFQDPLLFLVFITVFLFSLSFHEFCHALMASWLGDSTARLANRLTLNPLAHVDPLGFLALVTVGFGWGRPVPFNPRNLRYQVWGPTLVALAGPSSNLFLGILASLCFGWFGAMLGSTNLLIVALGYVAQLNFILLLFNLIPIPPLDGSKVLLSLLASPSYRQARLFLELRGPFLLLALIILDSFFGLNIFGWLGTFANSLMTFFVHLGGGRLERERSHSPVR